MGRLPHILLLFFGMLVFMGGLALSLDKPSFGGFIICLGVIFMGTAMWLSRQERKRDMAREKQRVAELTAKPWSPGQVLRVEGSRLAGMLPRLLGRSPRPKLELSSTGIFLPARGQIEWHEIHGIYLQKTTTRGSESYVLLLRLEDGERSHLPAWRARLSAALNLGASTRNVVVVTLWETNVAPESIESVARFLWTSATGRDSRWSPYQSAASEASSKRLSEFLARRRPPELPEFPEDISLKELEAQSARYLDELKRDHAEFDDVMNRYMKVHDDDARVVRRGVVLSLLLVAALLLAVAWEFYKGL